MKSILLALALVLTASSPIQEVRDTVESLKNIVKDASLRGDGQKAEKRERIRKLILERMDFYEMGKRSLGRHWKNYSEVQRKEYLDVFARYVEVFYRENVLNSIEFLENVGIKYLKERIDGEFAEADLEVYARNDKTKMTFKLHLVDGHWKSYDVVIEGVSIVSSFRAQFDRIIEKEKFEGLLRRLREKTKELDK